MDILNKEENEVISYSLYSNLVDYRRMNENNNMNDTDLKYFEDKITSICKKLNIPDVVYQLNEEEAEAYQDHLTYKAMCRDHNI